MNPPYTQMYISKCEICATFYRLIFKLKIIGHHFLRPKKIGIYSKIRARNICDEAMYSTLATLNSLWTGAFLTLTIHQFYQESNFMPIATSIKSKLICFWYWQRKSMFWLEGLVWFAVVDRWVRRGWFYFEHLEEFLHNYAMARWKYSLISISKWSPKWFRSFISDELKWCLSLKAWVTGVSV